MKLVNFQLIIAFILALTECDPSLTKGAAIEPVITLIEDVIYVNCKIDTSKITMVFDTGCLVGCVLSEKKAQEVLPEKDVKYTVNGYGVISADSMFIADYPYPSNDIIVYRERINPLIAPNYRVDRKKWSINLDSCSLTISDTTRFPSSIKVPIIFTNKRRAPFVKIPLSLYLQGDTLKTCYYYLLDTGNPYGMAITDPPKELERFVRSHSHMEYLDEQSQLVKNRKIVQFFPDIIFDQYTINDVKCIIDTGMRSIASEYRGKLPSDAPVVGTIGLRFLKHFNFELDLANDQLNLSKNNTVFPSKPTNKYDFWCNDDGKVRRIGIGGVAYEQGLRVGDVINGINNIPWNSLKKNYVDSLLTSSDELLVNTEDHRIRHLETKKR